MGFLILIFFSILATIPALAKTYGVLLSGGYDLAHNDYAYYDGLKKMHSGLRKAGVERENIFALYADGKDGINTVQEDVKNQRFLKVAVPLSLENDGRKDINYASTGKSISDVFDRLAKTTKAGDNLVFFVTDHGDKTDGIVLWNGQHYSVDQIQQQLKKLPNGVNVQVVVSACYGGQFLKLTGQNVCVVSKTDSDTPGVSFKNHSPFVTGFGEALAQKSTFMAAFEKAQASDISDNKTHITSLDYILGKVPAAAKNQPVVKCGFRTGPINLLIEEIDQLSSHLSQATDQRKAIYEKDLKAQLDSISSAIKKEKSTIDEWFRNRQGKSIEKLKSEWSSMTPTQQEKARPEYTDLAKKINKEDAEQMKFLNRLTERSKRVLREMRFLKDATPAQLNEYIATKRCLEK